MIVLRLYIALGSLDLMRNFSSLVNNDLIIDPGSLEMKSIIDI